MLSEADWNQLLSSLPLELRQQLRLAWQRDGDLGQRMQAAMASQLKAVPSNAGSKAVLMGADAIEFSASHVCQKLERLNEFDLVFTPAHDGGYVAVGCTPAGLAVFDTELPWGSSRVLELSLKEAEQKDIKTQVCLRQMDLDEPADFLTAQEKNLFPKSWKSLF